MYVGKHEILVFQGSYQLRKTALSKVNALPGTGAAGTAVRARRQLFCPCLLLCKQLEEVPLLETGCLFTSFVENDKAPGLFTAVIPLSSAEEASNVGQDPETATWALCKLCCCMDTNLTSRSPV